MPREFERTRKGVPGGALTIRGIRFDRQRALAGLAPGEPGNEEESECCDRLTELLDHGYPVPFAASWTGWKIDSATPM